MLSFLITIITCKGTFMSKEPETQNRLMWVVGPLTSNAISHIIVTHTERLSLGESPEETWSYTVALEFSRHLF